MTPSKQQQQQPWRASGKIACSLHIQSGDVVLTPPAANPHLLVSVSADLQPREDFADTYRNQGKEGVTCFLSVLPSILDLVCFKNYLVLE